MRNFSQWKLSLKNIKYCKASPWVNFMFVQRIPIGATNLGIFTCLLATIDMCNFLKSVLGLHKLASTDPDNVLDPQIGRFQLPTDRGGDLARGSGSCGGDNGLADNGGHSGLCPLLSTCVQGVASHPKPPGLQLQPSLPPESGSHCAKHQHAHCTCSYKKVSLLGAT